MGQLVFQATLGGQVNLVGPNTASTFNLNVPAVSSTIASLAAQTFAGTQTFTLDAVVNGLTVGKGAGAVSDNTAIGYQAGYTNSTGAANTYGGYQAGYTNSTGGAITAFGAGALFANTVGENSAFGRNALTTNSTGTNNTALGQSSLGGNTTGGYNAAGGRISLFANTTGSYNTAFGTESLRSNTTASNNTAVGYQAGYNTTTGAGVVCLGYQAQAANATDGYTIVIGAGTTGKGNATGFINPAGGGVYQGNNSTLWSITSDQRLKKNIVDHTEGLSKIVQLQVRNFEYRLPEEITELDSKNAVDIKGVQLGLIAQELNEVLPDCVKTESTGVMSVDATNITWHMVNAIKDLKALVDAQATEITALKAKVGI